MTMTINQLTSLILDYVIQRAWIGIGFSKQTDVTTGRLPVAPRTGFHSTRIVFQLKSVILVSLLSLGIQPVQAEPVDQIQSLRGEALKKAIGDYATKHIPNEPDEEIVVHVTHLDPNITLPACTTAIEMTISMNSIPSQSNSVKLSCNGRTEWNIFVPITVSAFTPVAIAKRNLSERDALSADDIAFEKKDKNQLNEGYFKTAKEAIGSVPRHRIAAGTVLTPVNTKHLPLVKKNQTIDLILKNGPIQVAMRGVAKSDGYLNESIKVLNPSSKKIIDAIVIDTNKAEVN